MVVSREMVKLDSSPVSLRSVRVATLDGVKTIFRVFTGGSPSGDRSEGGDDGSESSGGLEKAGVRGCEAITGASASLTPPTTGSAGRDGEGGTKMGTSGSVTRRGDSMGAGGSISEVDPQSRSPHAASSFCISGIELNRGDLSRLFSKKHRSKRRCFFTVRRELHQARIPRAEASGRRGESDLCGLRLCPAKGSTKVGHLRFQILGC